PLSADVKLNYDGPRNLITVPSSSIQLPATTIHAQGEVGNNSNLTITASSTDLHQLMQLASAVPKSENTTTAEKTGSTNPNIRGAANLNAIVRGTLQNPQITARLSATKLRVNQSAWDSVQMTFAANPSAFAIQNASLISARQG